MRIMDTRMVYGPDVRNISMNILLISAQFERVNISAPSRVCGQLTCTLHFRYKSATSPGCQPRVELLEIFPLSIRCLSERCFWYG